MVKNHQHGAIGHNKHGSRGAAPLSHDGAEPDNKRPRTLAGKSDEPALTALDPDSLARLLGDSTVTEDPVDHARAMTLYQEARVDR